MSCALPMNSAVTRKPAPTAPTSTPRTAASTSGTRPPERPRPCSGGPVTGGTVVTGGAGDCHGWDQEGAGGAVHCGPASVPAPGGAPNAGEAAPAASNRGADG